jgi:histidinol phosphatase-like PHP family hydrolase
MALAAAEPGYEYVAITDHSRAVAVVGGLGPRDLSRQWKEMPFDGG